MEHKGYKIFWLLCSVVVLFFLILIPYICVYPEQNLEKLTIKKFLYLNTKIEEGVSLSVVRDFTNSLNHLKESVEINKEIILQLISEDKNRVNFTELSNQINIVKEQNFISQIRDNITKAIKSFITDDIKDAEIKMMEVLFITREVINNIMLNKEIFESSQSNKFIPSQKTEMREKYSPKTNSIQIVKQIKPIQKYFKKVNEIKIENKQKMNMNNIEVMKSEKSKRPIVKQIKPIQKYFKKVNEIKIENKQKMNINNIEAMKSEKSKRPIIFYFGIAIFIIIFIILIKYSISSIKDRL